MEYLTNTGIVIEQDVDGKRVPHITGDAVALGNFVQCSSSDSVADIGCGTGVLTLLIAAKQRPRKIIAMDINEDAVKQTERNIKQNADKLSGTEFNVYSGDAKSICKTIGANTADIAVCNPPYFSTGKKPLNSNRSLARHDKTLTLDDLAAAATKILKFGGIIYFCYPAVKTAAAVTIFENNNFRVKEIKFITNKKGVYLTLFKCKKGGGHGTKIII